MEGLTFVPQDPVRALSESSRVNRLSKLLLHAGRYPPRFIISVHHNGVHNSPHSHPRVSIATLPWVLSLLTWTSFIAFFFLVTFVQGSPSSIGLLSLLKARLVALLKQGNEKDRP